MSVLFVVTVLPLFKALRSLSQKSMTLTKEVKMLTAIFTVFTLNYISRTIYDFVAEMGLGFRSIFTGFMLPIFWDILPIGLMLFYHLKASYYKNKQ